MMKKIVLSTLAVATALLFSGCSTNAATQKQEVKAAKSKIQTRPDIRIMSADNSAGKITVQSIEKAFEAHGFEIAANNNMNRSFERSFGKDDPMAGKDFKMYRLMPVYHAKHSIALIKKYPEFGLIAPLSTSVYSKNGKVINISSLSLYAMSRMTGAPETDPDLVALYDSLTKALEAALPGGTFKDLKYKILRPDGELVTRFAFVLPNDGDDIIEAIESYEEQMEGEAEAAGFVFPVFTDMTDALEESGFEGYDFYKTVSICNLKVIFPVHRSHPEVGAYAPCTIYKYKKKDDKYTRMGYPSVYNWTIGTEIEDDYSLEPLIDAQDLLEATIDSTIE
jgi:uncharacterized protein (DUF302 family)